MAHHTRLIELELKDLDQANIAFSAQGNITPLVLVPSDRGLFSLFMNVPSDSYVLMQKYGKHFPEDEKFFPGAGRKLLNSAHRIAYLVTKQACTYNAPVTSVPTKDNVNVEVDMTIVFTISDPYKFIYHLGVMRFDEYLHAAVDESIRVLVRNTLHFQLFDLKGKFAKKMLDDLKSKFEELGISFTNVTVTDVKLPGGLMKMLESIQTYETKFKALNAQQDFEMKKIKSEGEFALKDIERNKLISLSQLEAERQRAELEMKEHIARAEERKTLKTMQAERDAEILKKRAKVDFETSAMDAQKRANARVQDAEASLIQRRVEAEQEAQKIEKQGAVSFKEAENRVKGTLLQAEAEAKAQESLRQKRQHDLEIERLDILTRLARSGKISVVGEAANEIIKSIAATDAFKSK